MNKFVSSSWSSPQRQVRTTGERPVVDRSLELEESVMDDDKVLVILGELAGLKEQLDDCLDTDVDQFNTLEYFVLDQLKKEIKK